MKNILSFFIVILLIGFNLQSNAQDKAPGSVKSASVTFKTIVNGKESSRGGGPTLLVVNNQIKIAASRQGNRISKLGIPFEATYVDYLAKKTYQVAEFKSGKARLYLNQNQKIRDYTGQKYGNVTITNYSL